METSVWHVEQEFGGCQNGLETLLLGHEESNASRVEQESGAD